MNEPPNVTPPAMVRPCPYKNQKGVQCGRDTLQWRPNAMGDPRYIDVNCPKHSWVVAKA